MLMTTILRFPLVLLFSLFGIPSTALQQEVVAPPLLTSDATLGEVIVALTTAQEQYESLYIRITDYNHLVDYATQDEVWLSSADGAFRWEVTTITPEGEVLETVSQVSDGEYVYISTSPDGKPLVIPSVYESSAIVEGLGVVSMVIAPEVVANRLSEPAAQVEITGIEEINERETLKVMYVSEWSMMNFWIDTQTGILMQHDIWTPEGEIVSTTTVDLVESDPVFEDAESLFYVDAAAYDPERIQGIISQLETGQSGGE
ncbi:MAG: hypothetical protein OHK0046_11280 [Anaerolineae bacterium]